MSGRILTILVHAPATWRTCACRNARLAEEKPFRLVWTWSTKQQRCLWLVLIPTKYKWFYSHLTQLTRCACFCINSLLQSNNKHIHTACHSQTCYNFNSSVICIITVASKAGTSAYFFLLFRPSSIFLFSRSQQKKRWKTKSDVDSYDALLFHTW